MIELSLQNQRLRPPRTALIGRDAILLVSFQARQGGSD
jgi:hypothetical protein